MNLTHYQVLVRPRITEKAVFLQNEQQKYTFEIHPSANKDQVKKAIEALYDVKVTSVRTVKQDGKKRRNRMGVGQCAAWKKAIITLAEGQQIEGV